MSANESSADRTVPPARGALCLLAQGFPPEPLPVPKWIADALHARGWDVTVVTGQPNYPTGKVLDGYRARSFTRELMGPLKIRRTALYASHDHSAVRRFLNYGSWALSATLGGWREMKRADVTLVYSTPATSAGPAIVARLLTGKHYVLLIEDLWPDSIFASGFLTSGMLYKIAKTSLDLFCGLAYRLADHVAVISPGMVDLLAERGVSRRKLSVVYNWVDETVFQPSSPDPNLRSLIGVSDDTFLLMYAGNHGKAQKLKTAIMAMGQLPADVDAHLVMIGDGLDKPALQELAGRVAPERVSFLDSRPLTAMPATLAAADAQLVCLADKELFRITLPSKIQTALATGQPVIVSAPGDAARIVEEADAGQTARPEDPAALACAITELAALPRPELKARGARGRDFYLTHMAAAVGSQRLTDILAKAAHRKESR